MEKIEIEKNELMPEEKVSWDSLKVHQMPKKYKSGSFSYSEYSQKILNKPAKSEKKVGDSSIISPHIKAKKSGLLVMFLGILVLAFLIYGAYWFYKNGKDFSFPSFSLFNNKLDISKDVNLPRSESIDSSLYIPTSTDQIILDLEGMSSSSDDLLDNANLNSEIKDTDGDGLNDKEEELLGSDPAKSDSDGDGYNDLTELLGLYNPLGSGDIYTLSSIKKYQNNLQKYYLAYPTKFETSVIDNGASVIFVAEDESFIQVIVQDNEKKQSIEAWYTAEFLSAPQEEQLFQLDKFEGVRGSDNLTVYFTDNSQSKLYIISYTPHDYSVPVYLNIMELMLRSLTAIK